MKDKKTMPNFLVIGVKKAGTTWLYNLLKSHRCIYVPKFRKEVHFFDWNYSKGVGWYQSFFPKKRLKECTKAIGEATPGYIFDNRARERIQKHMPNDKFIITLRNPVDRLVSAYTYYRQRGGKNTFITFSRRNDKPYKMGLYSAQLREWFKDFNREQFLILIFEECISDPDTTKKRIAKFLEVDVNDFAIDKKKKRNPTFKVQNKWLYLIFVRFAALLRKVRLDYFIYIFKQTGILEFFKDDSASVESISTEKRSELKMDYIQSINELEMMLNRDLSIWK